MPESRGSQIETCLPTPLPWDPTCLVLAILRMTSRLEGDTQRLSIPGVGEGTLLGLSRGTGEREVGSKPSGSHAGLSLSQMSCCLSPFQHSRYAASPALSDESGPGASRGTDSQSGPAFLQKGPA